MSRLRKAQYFSIAATGLLIGLLALYSPSSFAETAKASLKPSSRSKTITELYTPTEASLIEYNFTAMGTAVSFLIASEDREKARVATDSARSEIERIENLMTDWRASPLEKLNSQAGIRPIQIDQELYFLLREAKSVSEITSGAFDITYAAVGKLWRFNTKNLRFPKADELEAALKLVNYRDLELKHSGSAFLRRSKMRVGLGAIAKGYAVDRASQKIEAAGFKNFAVNAGGDLIVRGRKDRKLWWVGIRDPRAKKKENLAILPVSNAAVVTSGDSERFFIKDGQRYSHIIDPKTGYPANGTQSVTIMAKKAYWADAFATGIFVLGPQKGMDLIEKQVGVEGVIVDSNGKLLVSSGLQK